MRKGRTTKDIHSTLRFWVEIDSVQVAGFSECSALTVETEIFEYVEGGLNGHTHKLPTRIKYGNITLKRGLDPGADLYDWYKRGLSGQPEKQRKSVSIVVYGPEKDKEVRRWELVGAIPVKWTGPDLRTDGAGTAIESLEFAHHGIVSATKG
jgi:phage tail-like protein